MTEMTAKTRSLPGVKLAIVGMDVQWGSCDGLDAFERSIYDGTQQFDAISAQQWQELKAQSIKAGLALEGLLLEKVSNRALGDLKSQANRVDTVFAGLTGITPESAEASLAQILERAKQKLISRSADAVLIGAVQCLAEQPSQAIPQATGEGAVALVLKLLQTALDAGDRIYAVIDVVVETSIEMATIQEAATQALGQANLDPSAIGYLEVSASSNPEENEIEIQGLLQTYQAATPPLSCAIGSVKTTIGHSQAAAGMASLIKTALCLYHRFLPATPNWPGVTVPQNWQGSPFYVPTESRPWFLATMDRRAAALSSVQPNGIYTHLVVSEEPSQSNRRSRYLQDMPFYLFPIAAEEPSSLLVQLQDLRVKIENGSDLQAVAKQAFTVFQAQRQAAFALAILGRNPDEALQEIQRALKGVPTAFDSGRDWQTPVGSYFTAKPLGKSSTIAFIYPGAFGAHVGLGRNLPKLFPNIYEDLIIKSVTQRLSKIEKLLFPRSLAKLSNRQLEQIEQQLMTDILTLLEAETGFASVMTTILRDYFQIVPQSVFGYSLGEITMMYAQGVWSDFNQGSQTLHTSPLFSTRISGPMEAIRHYWNLPEAKADAEQELWRNYILVASAAEVNKCLQQETHVYLTQINAAKEVVIGGDPQACQRVITALGCDAIRAPFNYAIHCPVIQSEYNELLRLNCLPVQPKSGIRFYSAATYAPIPQDSQSIGHNIAQALSQQLDFPRLLNRIYDDGSKIFIEVGASGMCSRWIGEALKQHEHVTVSLNRRGTDEHTSLLKALAKLLSHRVALDLSPLYGQPGDQPNSSPIMPPATDIQPQLGCQPVYLPKQTLDQNHYQKLSSHSSSLAKNHAVFLDSRHQSLQQISDLIQLQTRITEQFINETPVTSQASAREMNHAQH